MDANPTFDGQTFIAWRDRDRLQRQLAIVRTIMSDGELQGRERAEYIENGGQL